MLTVWPTAIAALPNSSSAVSGPSTILRAFSLTSSSVRNRPTDTARERTSSHDGVAATTVEVQVVSLALSVWLVEATGATPEMLGATSEDASASASALVRVVAEPKPPRTPSLVELPGEMISRLDPSALIWSLTDCCAPSPRPTDRVTDAMPIMMPRIVRMERVRLRRTASSATLKVWPKFTASPPSGGP